MWLNITNNTVNLTTTPLVPVSSFHDEHIAECYTTIAWRIILSEGQRATVASCLAILIPSTILLNIGLCIALYKTGQLKSAPKLLFLWLCISDSFVGLMTLPMSVVIFTTYGNRRSCGFEYTYMFMGQLNGHFSLYLVLAVALQRYLQVRPKFRSHTIGTRKSSQFLIMVCFILAVCHGFVSSNFFGWTKTRIPNTLLMIIRALLTISIYVCYFRLYYSIKRFHRNENKTLTTQTKQTQRSHVPKFFRTVFLVMISLALCYLPVVAVDLWTGYYTLIKKTPSAAPVWLRFTYYLTFFPAFLNSTLSAAIYLHKDHKSQTYIKQLVRDLTCDRNSLSHFPSQSNTHNTRVFTILRQNRPITPDVAVRGKTLNQTTKPHTTPAAYFTVTPVPVKNSEAKF
eukprot:gene17055-18773_t